MRQALASRFLQFLEDTPGEFPLSQLGMSAGEPGAHGRFVKTYAFYADDSGALVMIGALLLTSKQQIGNQWLKDGVKTTRA